MGDVKEFDYIDYILYYDSLSENDVLFVKDSFKYSDGNIVPVIWYHDSHKMESKLGYAVIENQDDGVIAKCTFDDHGYGPIAKELIANNDCGISVYASGVSYDLLQSTGVKIVHSADVMAVIVLPKVAIPKKKKEK